MDTYFAERLTQVDQAHFISSFKLTWNFTMNRNLLTSLLLLLTLSTPAFGAGNESAASPSQTSALQEVRARATAGNADAQFTLGGMYFKGIDVKQDYTQAIKWLKLAANQGLPQAQYNVGMMYDSGQGVVANHADAAHWYLQAAERGLALAQLNIGVAYANGEGVPQNAAEAVKWFRLAANQGNPQAQFDLGVMYANGQGTEQNLVESYRLAKLAYAQGHDIAKTLIRDLRKRMSPAQIAMAEKPATKTGDSTTEAHTRDTQVAANDTRHDVAHVADDKSEAAPESGNFYVQLGAFKSQKQAEEFMQSMHTKLGDLDKPYSLFSSAGWVRIHVGPYDNMNDARKSADTLQVKTGYLPKIRQH